MNEITKLSPRDILKHLRTYVKNCEAQINKGKLPTSLCLEGPAGISKTSIIKQLAQEFGYKLHQINAAMIDDLGHLTGFPEREFRLMQDVSVVKDGYTEKTTEYRWTPTEFMKDMLANGYKTTGESRMNYAIPHWLKDLGPDDKFILLLDDFTRGMPMVMQACMTLVEEYRYGSWSLPKNSIIILTTNPDDGNYSVASLDFAQRTRMRYVNMRFDVSSWAEWAEKTEIDSRCINFVLHNEELFSNSEKGIGTSQEYNARSMTKFFDDICNLPDFAKDLEYVKICGDGAVGQNFTDLFITFINSKLDKLVNPRDLFNMSSADALATLTDICGDYTTNKYEAPIASLMSVRITNFLIHTKYISFQQDDVKKALAIILHSCFSDDLKTRIVTKLIAQESIKINPKVQLIAQHPDIIKMIQR